MLTNHFKDTRKDLILYEVVLKISWPNQETFKKRIEIFCQISGNDSSQEFFSSSSYKVIVSMNCFMYQPYIMKCYNCEIAFQLHQCN